MQRLSRNVLEKKEGSSIVGYQCCMVAAVERGRTN